MGFSKWILTHGIGSPGAIAKAMVKSYLFHKERNPSFSNELLLGLVAEERINIEKKFGIINPFSIEKVLEMTECDLKKMIKFFVMIENQDANGFPKELPIKTQFLVSDVISEVVDKYTYIIL